MSARPRRSSLLREARFERFEERLALSAQPVADFYLSSQVEPGIEIHFEQLEQHLEDLQELDKGLAGEIAHHTGQLEPHLGDVLDLTGVHYAYNTYGFTGAGQTVAVIDSGIAWDHVALGGGLGTDYRVVGGWDFAENDADPYDDGPEGFHGTHVTGIIGSSDSTYRGVASGVDLVGLRVFDDDGAGYFSWVESALQWVHDHRHDFANPITTVNMSLGTDWNSDSIPNWTTIEDELAQLEQDGMFIAVSAGNSFANYNTPGLSYPAASPYVIPIASVTNDGSFSDFSQRHDRVIAAPGSSITSTVPDYLFGPDGNPNDFGTASGTSMASPYVAGASVLVRQAMEFVGIQNITQDTIYDHFRNTADIFYDDATSASYHRLNVQAALDALMPEDDYGSDANSAHDLGTISDVISLSGLIGTTADEDFFTFTAGETGVISFAVDTSFDLALDARLLSGNATFENETLTFEVVAGESYTISFGTENGIGYYGAAIELIQAATIVKELDHNGLTYSLDSDGWLSVNGRQVWNETQDFSFGDDGSLYWLGTSGVLQRKTAQGWQTLGQAVEKFAVSANNTVYSLDTDDWLCRNGNRVWSKTKDFGLGQDGSLHWLSTFGLLQRKTAQGWQTLGQAVEKFAVDANNTVYSLDTDNWLCRDGNRVWSKTKDFELGHEGSLYWLSTFGLLQRRFQGTWETIDSGVVSFQLNGTGEITYQTSGGSLLTASSSGSRVTQPVADESLSSSDRGHETNSLDFSEERAGRVARPFVSVFATAKTRDNRVPTATPLLQSSATELCDLRSRVRATQSARKAFSVVRDAVLVGHQSGPSADAIATALAGRDSLRNEELDWVDSLFDEVTVWD